MLNFNKDRLLKTYYQMIRIKSISGSEYELAQYIFNNLESAGLMPKLVYFENGEHSPSLVCKISGNPKGKKLLLIGHLDTVQVNDEWDTDPFIPHIVGNRVYGRGSMDMKGGLAAIIETVRTIIDNNIDLIGELIIALVSDEEYMSRGTYNLLMEGLTADMAIMAECRFDEAAIGFRGRYSINVNIKGVSGHASKYPTIGDNAIIKASKLAIEIEKLSTKYHKHLGNGTWCVRNIEGGYKKTLTIPDSCSILVDRYVVPGEDYEFCRNQIIEAAKKLNMEKYIAISLLPRPLPYMEAFSISKNEEIVEIVSKNFKTVTGKDLSYSYDTSVCDSNFLATIGNIPVITFGPSGENMHGANEYAYLDQILMATEIYIKTVVDILT